MSEETRPEDPAPKKKPATRRAASTSSSANKKPAAKKAPVKKATASKPATKSAAASASKDTNATQSEAIDDLTLNTNTDSGQGSNTAGSQKDTDTVNLVEDLKSRNWPEIIKRALLMFFFGILGTAALYVSFVLATAQVVISIIAGEPNTALTRIMKQCGSYLKDVLDYLSFASDECPFPFGRDWPEGH